MVVSAIRRAAGRVAAVMLIASSSLTAQVAELAPTPKPLAPGVSATLDSARAERGARMSVAIVTYGPGAFVFEKFGHIALALTDSTTGEDLALNWGMFDFNQPNFLARFLTGDTKYWMAGYRTADFNAAYMGENRTIRQLDLQLTAVQRGAIADFVRWNAQDANKYYRYDYYADNCATRVRDVLNWALRGQLDVPFAAPGSGRTWRNETARITASDPLVYAGIQVALGRNADHVLTKWEESFLPDLLANRLAALTVTDANGAPVKLVVSVLWFGVGGLLGTALLLAGAVTKHAPYMGANLTVLQVHPLMLLAAVVVTVALWRRTRTGAAAGVAALVALLSVVGLTLQLVPVLSQESGVVLAVVVPVQVAFAVAVLRLRPRVRPDGATP